MTSSMTKAFPLATRVEKVITVVQIQLCFTIELTITMIQPDKGKL